MRCIWIQQKFAKRLKNLAKLTSFRGLFDLEGLEEEIAILENKMTEPDFWNDNLAAQKTSQELNELKILMEISIRCWIYMMNLKFC